MTPSSYANAAGLQSEINHVTITRVAFSEVQYRRSVNSYRRDMRFTINAISREQKRLRRSMRDYSRVLRRGRRERERRKQMEWEEAKKDNSSHSQSLVIDQEEPVPEPDATAEPATAADLEDETTKDDLTKSDSTLVTSESDVKDNTGEGKVSGKKVKKQKSIDLHSGSRGKAFFRPKRNLSKHSSVADSEAANEDESDQTNGGADTITEETLTTENGADRAKDDIEDRGANETLKESSHPENLRLNLHKHSQDDDQKTPAEGVKGKWQLLKEKHRDLLPEDSPVKRRRNKDSVTYGDLIKLQHTRGSKKLFQLVDKLAKHHGVKEEAPPAPAPLPDTRDTARLVSKHDQGFTSIFRAAEAFYPIKYGYAVTEEMGKFVFLPAIDVVQESEEETLDSPSLTSGAPKPIYGNLVSPAENSDFWSRVNKELDTRRSDSGLQTPGKSERRAKRVLSLPSLVKAVSKFKQGVSDAARPRSEVIPDTRDSTAPPSSRGGEISRASGKTSSDRTPNLPRKLPPMQRLVPEGNPEESSTVGWKVALQSMKLVHTLEDLKHHF